MQRSVHRKVVAAAGLLAVVGWLLALHPARASDATEQIPLLIVKWEKAFAEGDIDWIANIYTTDGLLLPPGSPAIEGREAIHKAWKGYREIPGVAFAFESVRVEASPSGDMAWEFGTYTFDFDSDTGRVETAGKYILVWKKVDGAWQVAADIFNGNSQ